MATEISKIKINATADRIWELITQPEFVKLWQYGSELDTDWGVGSDISFSNEWEGKIFRQWGKILEFRPAEVLKYSLFFPRPGVEDKPENYFVMMYRLTPDGADTLLEIIKVDSKPVVTDEEPKGEDNPVLLSLKALAEEKIG